MTNIHERPEPQPEDDATGMSAPPEPEQTDTEHPAEQAMQDAYKSTPAAKVTGTRPTGHQQKGT
jgi:hypothetical protein